MGPPPVHRGFFHQWGWKKAGMAARKAEGKRRGHRAAVPPARPMRRHRPREGGKRSIGRERLPDSYVPPSPIPWKRARNQPGMYFVGNGRKIAHVANGVIRTGKNDSGGFPTRVGGGPDPAFRESFRPGFPHARGGVSKCHSHPRSHLPSSPRAWGCFPIFVPAHLKVVGFPTYVGVFPTG